MATTRREFIQSSALVVGALLTAPESATATGRPEPYQVEAAPAGSALARVVAYVDGQSLYHGLRARGWLRYNWLDVPELARNLLRSGQVLVATKYFTARAPQMDASSGSQAAFLDALTARGDTQLFYGKFHANPAIPDANPTLRSGRVRAAAAQAKRSDVTLAVELLGDAFQDAFDVALLISGDSDLVPALKAVRRMVPAKRIVVAFPPRRVPESIKQIAHAYVYIGRDKLAHSQLPAEVVRADGFRLTRPASRQ